MLRLLFTIISFLLCFIGISQIPGLDDYDPVWTTQSKNSSESMPVGGGDIGCNVWVENGAVYFYFSRSGTFDENNTFLKLGRVKLELSPNPFISNDGFKQQLHLKDGFLEISQNGATIKIWADVFSPVIYVKINSEKRIEAYLSYESWRHNDRQTQGKENNQNSYKWAPPKDVFTYADSISLMDKGILFFHRNKKKTVFDVVVKQQKMESVKEQMFNPLKNLTFGGYITGSSVKQSNTYSGTYQGIDFKGYQLQSYQNIYHEYSINLATVQSENLKEWEDLLFETVLKTSGNSSTSEKRSKNWWNNYWHRSFIYTGSTQKNEDTLYQIGRNYQLFRYMLGCNAYGKYPTKFNGGLFTVDPVFTDSTATFTPDFRNWGGGTMTAQNQRLVYFPMLKSGDFELMLPQFQFYLQMLKNAELRSKVYWNHGGASFTEQIENFGLPNPAEYNWDRPEHYDPGMQYNAWLEHQWDTVFEFCLMMIAHHEYAEKDIQEYIPFIMSCLQFFDEHYQYLAKQRGSKIYDENGHLVLYPGSANETYKMAYNANSTISALKVITEKLLALPQFLTDKETDYLETFAKTIPPLNFREVEGYKMLAPAKLWERVNNTEVPQLYPVYPWGLYGVGKNDLEIARNTYQYDPDALKFRSHVGWKQDNIFAARLGLTDEAAKYTKLKMANSGRRFPAFWGPGFDWVPDHNWGGSGMIGMQEMLLQTVGDSIYLFPAWPKKWDVHFKLHAPQNTVVEAQLKNGNFTLISITPAKREADIVNILPIKTKTLSKSYK